MTANTWAPEMYQGGDFSPFVERITYRLRHAADPFEFEIPKTAKGLRLPGFEGKREYPDEVWRLTANMPLTVQRGVSNPQVDFGFYNDEIPFNTGGHADPKRLTQTFFSGITALANTTTFHTWVGQTWFVPTKPIGVPQKFSVWMFVFGDQGASSSAIKINPGATVFTLERFRTGPYFGLTRSVIPNAVPEPI